MKQGRIVEVRLHGDDFVHWYRGKVIKARKIWVQFDKGSYWGQDFIADESNIKAWRYPRKHKASTKGGSADGN